MNVHRLRRVLAAAPVALAASVLIVVALEQGRLSGQQPAPSTPAARAELKTAKGDPVGVAQLTETPAGVLIHANFSGLPPGVHAFHIHDVGQCEPPDFKSAGGHFNPGGQHHGFTSPQGAHAGDLPNLYVGENGKVEVDVVATGVTLGSGSTGLLDANGASLVIHQAADDYSSDPAGNAGARLACGVVRRQ